MNKGAGTLVIEGKTKRIVRTETPRVVQIESKDDITAGDGAKKDTIPNKGEWATRTTANVFELLRSCGIPTSFLGRRGKTAFRAVECEMIPYEVVVRREMHGSALKRNPEFKKGHVNNVLVPEFYLKTNGRKWEQHDLPCDDPYTIATPDGLALYLPSQPLAGQQPFLVLKDYPLMHEPDVRHKMGVLAIETFLILEKAWQLLGKRLVDFKVEFGFMSDVNERSRYVVLSDVIDNDSWRLLDNNGRYLDKQIYRDGGNLDEIATKYATVAELSDLLVLPKQQIILWSASEKDDTCLFEKALGRYAHNSSSIKSSSVKMVERVGSLHKSPVAACKEIAELVQKVPDSVLIVFCGRSNGAGPTLSAQTTIPTITVPAGWEKRPEDIWSSLRTPSDTPCATVLEPGNAILLALEILAQRNPEIYAALRQKQEERLANFCTY